jgi:hypothetical protein
MSLIFRNPIDERGPNAVNFGEFARLEPSNQSGRRSVLEGPR